MRSTERVNNPQHRDLLERMDAWLRSMDFHVQAFPYHDVMPGDIAELLRIREDHTALYIRTRADRTAVHKRLPIQFEYDGKSGGYDRWGRPNGTRDLTLEAFPLAIHQQKWDLAHIRCLYAFRHAETGEGAFWVGEESPSYFFRELFIPSCRYNDARYAEWESIFTQAFPGVKIRPLERAVGSNTPFLVVDNSKLRRLGHWQDLITDYIDMYSNNYAD